jgi:hypothetical protein
MNTHLEHTFLSVQHKLTANGKPARGRTRILTDSVRKRNKKEVLANYNVHEHKENGWTFDFKLDN